MDTQMNVTPENQQALSTIDQDVLCLEMSPVDQSTADSEIALCNTHLFLNGAPINHGIDVIPHAAMEKLKVAAMLLKTTDLNYVLAVKMHFVLDEDGERIELLYQPLYMSRPASDIGEPMYSVREGGYYYYDRIDKNFYQISQARKIDALKASYRNNIRILHRLDVTPTSYIPGLDSDAAIFPFQTIEELMHDNEGNAFYIHNSIRKEAVGGAFSIQHCLLLSSVTLTGNSFKGKFANRSHLCPPSCNVIQYALAKI